MKIDILAFGIAKDIIRGQTLKVEMPDGATVGTLKAILTEQFPGFEKLRSLAIAVNAEYRPDDFTLSGMR